MHKIGLHRIVLLLLLAMPFTKVAAQQTDTTVVISPSVSQVSVTTDTASQFDSMENASSVQARTVPDSVIKKIKADGDYWYVNTVPPRQKQKEEKKSANESLLEKSWFNNLVWFLMVGSFIAILIWFLASSNIQLFRKKSKAVVNEDLEITEENIFSIDYEKEISKAIADQNFRLAIRLWYLRTLKEMNDRNIIQYKHEKTNSDYLHQIESTSYYAGFFRLTRNFEFTWYGQFNLQPNTFNLLQKDFLTFHSQLQ